MIDFELEPQILNQTRMYHMAAAQLMRPISREFDENEHGEPRQFWEAMWTAAQNLGPAADAPSKEGDRAPRLRNLYTCLSVEELCWGDAGLFLSIPGGGLGGAAVAAAGTPEQRERFLKRFREGWPKWGAMAITEPSCGSDSAAITTSARLGGNHHLSCARRRPLGDQRHQDLLYRGPDGGGKIRRLRRGLGDP